MKNFPEAAVEKAMKRQEVILRAGKPYMTCPILYPVGDQMFWGKLGFEKGLAAKPIPLAKMTEAKFLESSRELLANRELYENARKMKQMVDKESGLQETIAEIEGHFSKAG